MNELKNESNTTISSDEKLQLLNRYVTYRDENDHIFLLLEVKSPPKAFSRHCPPCGTTQKFNKTREPDLIDIECSEGHRHSIDPPSVKTKSSNLLTFVDGCDGCGEEKTFVIDWTTRKREVDAWKITDL